MTTRIRTIIVLSILALWSLNVPAQTWQSSMVYYGANGKLQYPRDANKNRIPDFSYAGYKRGEAALPAVATVLTISPVAGDNTTNIQNAINQVGAMPLVNGIRGALLLNAGMYRVSGTLKVNFDGVVLRGVGDGSDSLSNTIIYATGDTPHQRTVIIGGGGSNTKWSGQVSGTKTNITSDTVLVGDSVITVASASSLSVGDNIIIYHPSTDTWLQAIDYGGTHSNEPGAEPGVDVPWVAGSTDILFNRYIKAKSGNTLTLDIPVYNHLIKSLSQSYVYKYNRSGLKTNIGIENLRVDIEYSGAEDENHAWEAIEMIQIEDGWIKNCTAIHFGHAGFQTSTATRITIQDCKALDPISIITGERRYNFCVYAASQQVLFKNCYASNGRHQAVSNGTSSTSGNVFLNFISTGSYAPSEGHRQWTQGMLFDNFREVGAPQSGYGDTRLALYNRGYYGTSHGWAMVHSVAWNCDVLTGDILIQKPPTGQNYGIGCKGAHITGAVPYAPFNEPEGFIEGSNQSGLFPTSLYTAQLTERLGAYTEPTTPASNASVIAISTAQVKVQWTKGNGTFRVVIAKKDSAADAVPSDYVTYTDNSVFGSGTAITTGNYVVYKGIGDSVTVSGLSGLTNYHFAVYEFNGAAGYENYLASNPARCNTRTPSVVYYSNGSGGGIWDSTSTWQTGVVPDSNAHVMLNGSDTVRVTRSGIKVYNITVPSAGKLIANGSNIVAGNVKYLIVTGTDVVNNGLMGTGTDGLSLKIVDSCRISGSSPVKLARILPQGAASKVVIGNDVSLTYRAGATSSGGAIVLADGGTIPVPAYQFQKIDIAIGKTLSFANYSKLQQSSSQDQDWNVNTTVTVNGTLTMGDSSTGITMRATPGNTISLIVNGNVSCRVLTPYSVTGNNPASIAVNQNANLTVGQGISGACDFSGPSVSVTGAGTFTLLSGALFTMGSPYGLDTTAGHVRTAFRNLSSGANYTFAATIRQSTGNGFPSATNNLTLNNTSGLIVSKNLDVNGVLTLSSGRIYLQNSNLTMGTSSSIAGTFSSSRMIVTDGSGSLRKRFSGIGSFLFPCGDTIGAGSYSPVQVSFSSGGFSSGIVSAAVSPVKHPKNFSSTHFLNRYWRITQTGISNTVASVTATYADGDIAGNELLFKPAVWDTMWKQNGSLNTVSNQLLFSGLSSFGEFTAADSLSVGGSGILALKFIPEGYFNTGSQTLNIRDTFFVGLASTVFPYSPVDSAKVVLDSASFTANALFSKSLNGVRYVLIKNRNHLETWSRAGGFSYFKGGFFSMDFTSDSSAAFGNNMKKSGNRWFVYAGDISGDGIVDFTDLIMTDNDNLIFASGYLATDVTGDGFVDFSDLSIVDNNSNHFISAITPTNMPKGKIQNSAEK